MGFSLKSVAKGWGHVVKGVVTGNLHEAVGGVGQMVGGKKKGAGSVSDTAEQKLITEQAESREKRRRLFATDGGALGAEVENVGLSGDVRGSIFGNRRV